MAQGKSSKDIALLLQITPLTVRKHRANIFAALGIHCVADLAGLYLQTIRTDTP